MTKTCTCLVFCLPPSSCSLLHPTPSTVPGTHRPMPASKPGFFYPEPPRPKKCLKASKIDLYGIVLELCAMG